MAAKQTWSKMDWPGVNLILKGTMGLLYAGPIVTRVT